MLNPLSKLTSWRSGFRTAGGVARILAALVIVSALAACSAAEPDEGGGWPLVWEAWRQIDESYAYRDSLQEKVVIGAALTSLLALNEAYPYPFLANVGRLRGQPPAGVPAEMTDLWRGLVLHRSEWPQTSDSARTEAVITSMVDALGLPSAAHVPAQFYPQASENLKKGQAGTYLGIGARVSRRGGQVMLDPYDNSPADKAGVVSGDILTAVGGRPVADRTVDGLIELITGPEGTRVELRVERAGEESEIDIDVFRGTVQLPSVNRQLAPGGIGYIFIDRFRENTGQQFSEALEVMAGFDMLALILDLRSNPGGSMEAATQVAAALLPPGSLFLSTQRPMGDREDHRLEKDPNTPSVDEIPMVVLINERTMVKQRQWRRRSKTPGGE